MVRGGRGENAGERRVKARKVEGEGEKDEEQEEEE